MNDTQSQLSLRATKVASDYLDFCLTAGGARISIPYFNNRTVGARLSNRVYVGKGSPTDIREEVLGMLIKNHVSSTSLTAESLKKLLVDHHIGVDCSALAYHILDAEVQARGKGELAEHLVFDHRSLAQKIASKLSPAKHTDVATFADEKNSSVVPLAEARAGDLICLLSKPELNEPNHILVITAVNKSTDTQKITLDFIHAISYPEDGLYRTGVRTGTIDISTVANSLVDGVWRENLSPDQEAVRLKNRAAQSVVSLRRLSSLM